jgi:hypothetical protein
MTKRPARPERPGAEIRTPENTPETEPEQPVPAWLRFSTAAPGDELIVRTRAT